MRSLTADAIAALTGGTVLGDRTTTIRGVAPLGRAEPSDVSFLTSARYLRLFAESRAGVVLVSPELADSPSGPSCRIVVARPHDAMLRLLPALYPIEVGEPGMHPTAILGRGVTLGAEVSIGAWTVIGDGVNLGDRVRLGSHCDIGAGVLVGDDSRLYAGVTLYEGTRVGKRVRLHAGVRLGSDGFGYVYSDGAHAKMPHVGRCLVEDDVEIGANTTIDRGSIDDTVIGAGTKIDNLVHIAHNVHVGRLCLIMAQAGIAGSAQIEDGCIVAGQAGIGGHATIGRGARIAAQAGVFGDVPAGESWSGYPARPHREALRAQGALFKLASIWRRLERAAERPNP
ncbi:MAG: UDP-3-O-(3-hydroxymyristoyl)glucosamine N-acyltransferase [Gemmatimonadaceae bacterium]